MEFEWDPIKHARNFRERGIGFDAAALIFDSRVVEVMDTRRDYGEVRVKAIGEVEGVILAVIYTDRDGVRRIISARRATSKERTLWHGSPSRS